MSQNFFFAVSQSHKNHAIPRSSASPTASDLENSGVTQMPAIAFVGRVTETADLLDPPQEIALTAKLERLERSTKHQMVIVTVPSLGGRDIAHFTRDLTYSWGIGRDRENDGVVLLVARDLVERNPERCIASIAEEHGRCRTRLGKLVRLSCLAPDIVQAIVEGRQPETLDATSLRGKILPLDWASQRVMLGFC